MNVFQGIAIDQANGNVYVSDQGNRRFDEFDLDGTYSGFRLYLPNCCAYEMVTPSFMGAFV